MTKQPDLPSRDLGSSQDNTTPKALGHEADNLDEFIRQLEPELRVGGGATLDELYNLALAVRDDLIAIKELEGK